MPLPGRGCELSGPGVPDGEAPVLLTQGPRAQPTSLPGTPVQTPQLRVGGLGPLGRDSLHPFLPHCRCPQCALVWDAPVQPRGTGTGSCLGQGQVASPEPEVVGSDSCGG